MAYFQIALSRDERQSVHNRLKELNTTLKNFVLTAVAEFSPRLCPLCQTMMTGGLCPNERRPYARMKKQAKSVKHHTSVVQGVRHHFWFIDDRTLHYSNTHKKPVVKKLSKNDCQMGFRCSAEEFDRLDRAMKLLGTTHRNFVLTAVAEFSPRICSVCQTMMVEGSCPNNRPPHSTERYRSNHVEQLEIDGVTYLQLDDRLLHWCKVKEDS